MKKMESLNLDKFKKNEIEESDYLSTKAGQAGGFGYWYKTTHFFNSGGDGGDTQLWTLNTADYSSKADGPKIPNGTLNVGMAYTIR